MWSFFLIGLFGRWLAGQTNSDHMDFMSHCRLQCLYICRKSTNFWWLLYFQLSVRKALAKRTRKSTQVLDLRSTCVSFGHPLTSTCDDLRWLWSSSNMDASRRKLLPFGHPAQVDTSWSQVIYCYKNTLTNDMREIYGFLRLANPLGHPSQVRTQVPVLSMADTDLRPRNWPQREIVQKTFEARVLSKSRSRNPEKFSLTETLGNSPKFFRRLLSLC